MYQLISGCWIEGPCCSTCYSIKLKIANFLVTWPPRLESNVRYMCLIKFCHIVTWKIAVVNIDSKLTKVSQKRGLVGKTCMYTQDAHNYSIVCSVKLSMKLEFWSDITWLLWHGK